MHKLHSTEAVAAQIELREMKRKPGWMMRGFWTCDYCLRITLPIGDGQNKCCLCGGLLTPQDFTKPLEG